MMASSEDLIQAVLNPLKKSEMGTPGTEGLFSWCIELDMLGLRGGKATYRQKGRSQGFSYFQNPNGGSR